MTSLLPKYIKYCDQIHRINNCKTIRIGSYNLFRNIEDNAIQDLEEGTMDGGHIENFTTNAIPINNPGWDHFMKKSFNIEKLSMGHFENITIKQRSILPNMYFFSVSEPPYKDEIMKKLGKDSFYEIINPLDFARILQIELTKKLKIIGLIGITTCHCHNIEYVNNNFLNIPTEHPTVQYIRKDKKRFQDENEWRFSFPIWKMNKKEWIEPPTDYIDLPVTEEMKKCCNFSIG